MKAGSGVPGSTREDSEGHAQPAYSSQPKDLGLPDDFPRLLERFGRECGLTRAEMARRLGIRPQAIKRWRDGVRPNSQHIMALLTLSESLGMGHPLTGKGQRQLSTVGQMPKGRLLTEKRI